MRSMAVGSVRSRNNVNILGDPSGRPIMFGHGLGSTQHMWRGMTPEFVDHSVVLFDLTGSGESDLDAYDSTRYDSPHGHADELDLHDVVYVGHSVSAIVGVLAANREPAPFGALVLVSASPRYLNDVGYAGGFSGCDVERLLDRMDSDFTRQAAAGHVADTRRHQIERHFARVALLSDHRRDLGGIVTPTLLVHGTDDPMTPPAVARYLHAAIPGSTLVVMSASGPSPNPLASMALAGHIRAYVR